MSNPSSRAVKSTPTASSAATVAQGAASQVSTRPRPGSWSPSPRYSATGRPPVTLPPASASCPWVSDRRLPRRSPRDCPARAGPAFRYSCNRPCVGAQKRQPQRLISGQGGQQVVRDPAGNLDFRHAVDLTPHRPRRVQHQNGRGRSCAARLKGRQQASAARPIRFIQYPVLKAKPTAQSRNMA